MTSPNQREAYGSQQLNSEDLARRYREGTLSPEQAEAYEIYLMEHPQRVDDLVIDKAFSRHLPEVSCSSAPRTDVLAWLGLRAPQFAMVALMAFGLGIWLAPVLSPTSHPPGTYQSADIIYLSPVRGTTSEPDAVISLSQQSEEILLVVQTGDLVPNAYSVTLMAKDQSVIHQRQDMRSNNEGDLLFNLETATLPKGLVSVVYQGAGEASEPTQLLLSIVP